MRNIKDDIMIKLEPKYNAFPYQADAFGALKDLSYGAIFHEQGLGKTKIAIDLSLYWLREKEIDTVLIVTKKQLVNNWIEELQNHSFVKAKVLNTDKGNNYNVMNSTTRIIVTNFETILNEEERIELFLKCRNVAIIIDESTKLKNPESKLTKVFFRLSPLFKIKIIMTGTPVANRPYDIWSQIYFLDEGLSLGDDFSAFKSNADLKNDFKNNKSERESFEKEVSSVYDKIKSFSVRETKRTCGIELPKKTHISLEANFSQRQMELYKDLVTQCQIEINRDGETILDDSSASLKRLIRLNQITSNPRLIDNTYNEESGKETVLNKLIEAINARGEKCIIWSSFIENVDYFCEKYKKFNACKIHGEMEIEERNQSVENFKKDDNCRILIATPQAAKEGLTLTVANNVIFYDRTFNLDDYLQAQDRIHRISQTKECFVYNIMMKNSIDQWIDALLNAKQTAAWLAQGDITTFKYEEIIDYSYGDIIKKILEGQVE